jgi:hypothetical protein
MPYYIYKVFRKPILRLVKIEMHEGYRAASARVKILREEWAPNEVCEVKLIFAENELGAEDLLSQVREPSPEMDDD